MELKHHQAGLSFEFRRYDMHESGSREPGYRIRLLLNEAEGIGIRGGKVLSVACGNRNAAEELVRSGRFEVDSLFLDTKSIIYLQGLENGKGSMPDLGSGKYDIVSVDHMFEYLNPDNKKTSMERLIDVLKGGGILSLTFPTSLPGNFIEERLEYMERPVPLVHLFRDHAGEKAVRLEFESGIVDALRNAGWSVLKLIDYSSERNLVDVQESFAVLRKPEQ